MSAGTVQREQISPYQQSVDEVLVAFDTDALGALNHAMGRVIEEIPFFGAMMMGRIS